MRLRVGEVIEPEEVFAVGGEEGPLDDAYARVEGTIQALVCPPGDAPEAAAG